MGTTEGTMEGPWTAEPDREEWRHSSGLACLARRGPMGAWCGYVAVPPGHRCAHAFDLVPGMSDFGIRPEGVYRDLAYVRDEVNRLADQLAAATT